MEDEDRPKPRVAHAVGEPLDTLSIYELDQRVALLEAEIERLKAASRAKQGAASVADTFFKPKPE